MIKENDSQPLLSGKQYWKSLDELAETSEFRTWVDKEFPEGAELLDNVQRRGFLKTMAASLASQVLVWQVAEGLSILFFHTEKALRS
jgi:MoCo/4Fe-4S cofactor protein with predicted Tat translocation signal